MIKIISASETFSVRHPVLRAGKPIESCHFDGDELNVTRHFGFFEDQILVGVVSLFERKNALFSEKNQYQIRGMAVLENYRKKGIGEKLIRFCENYFGSKDQIFWFNARLIAVGFYEKLGYKKIGLPFIIQDVSQHYLMFKQLGD